MKFQNLDKSTFVQTMYNNNILYKNILNNINKRVKNIKDIKKEYTQTKNTKAYIKQKKALESKLKRLITIHNKDIKILKQVNDKVKLVGRPSKPIKSFKEAIEFIKKEVRKMYNFKVDVLYWSSGWTKREGKTKTYRTRHISFNILGNYTQTELLNKKINNIYSHFVDMDETYGLDEAYGNINDLLQSKTQRIMIKDNKTNKMRPTQPQEDLKKYYHVIKEVRNYDYTKVLKGDIEYMPLNFIKYNKLPLNIKSNDSIIESSCVSYYLNQVFGNNKNVSKLKKTINNYENWTVGSFLNFLETNFINYTAYTQNLKKYKTYTDNKDKVRIPRLYFIISNEHIYALDKKEVKDLFNIAKIRDNINDMKYEPNTTDKAIELLSKYPIKKFQLEPIFEDNIYDDNEEEYYTKISKFVSNETFYTNDDVLYDIYKFSKSHFEIMPIGFDFSYITPLLLCLGNDSYSDVLNYMNQPNYPRYNNPSIYKYDAITIDKNKAFGYIIENLEYIPIIKYSHNVKEFKEDMEIDENYFYYVSNVNENYYNLVYIGWQMGAHLKLIPKTKYTITKFIVPTLKKNPLKDVMRGLRKYSTDIYKMVYSVFIGCSMKKSISVKEYYNSLSCSFDETGIYKGNVMKIKGSNNMLYADSSLSNGQENITKSLLPISHAILSHMSKMMINKINSINEKQQIDVISIKVDSLTFQYINENQGQGEEQQKIYYNKLMINRDILLSSLNNKDFDGWKRENKQLDQNKYNRKDYPEKQQTQLKLTEIKQNHLLNFNILFNCNAGSGKTYYTKNIIIPLLEKNNKSYIVLSTKHCIRKMYAKDNQESKVIQSFQYNETQRNKIKEYEYIIIDECGLLEIPHYRLLLENIKQNQKIICLGDFTQLSPIGSKPSDGSYLDKPFIKDIFDIKINCVDNYRNHYTVEDYDNMRNGKYQLSKRDYQIIYTPDTPFEKVIKSTNVCITREYMNELNNKIVQYLGFTDKINDMLVKKDELLIAEFRGSETSKQLLQKKYDIYNAFYYKLIDFDNEYITLETETHELKTIPHKLFISNFNYPYCRTLYRAQGESIPEEKYLIHELHKMKFANNQQIERLCEYWKCTQDELNEMYNRRLYTALSRVQTN